MTRTLAPRAASIRLAEAVRRLLGEVAVLLRAIEHRRAVRQLADLDERILTDIGLSRRDVQRALREPVFRNPSVLLVRSVERARRQEPARRRGTRP
jgi:uncharacterized protein YjiS (DUF1127 family)